jgi:hypothetical protein
MEITDVNHTHSEAHITDLTDITAIEGNHRQGQLDMILKN